MRNFLPLPGIGGSLTLITFLRVCSFYFFSIVNCATVFGQAELLADINSSEEITYNEFSNLRDGVGKLYYVSEQQHLWINFQDTNSMEAAVKLRSFVHIDQLTMVGNVLYFSADDGSLGTELWKSDGTASGTVLVKDIWPGTGSGEPQKLTVVNNQIYFTATTSIHGREIWKSTGSSAGTVMVKDIFPKVTSSKPDHLTNVNGVVYFSASDGVHGFELWKTDGTSTGTVLVKDIRTAYKIGSAPQQIVNVNGVAYFTAAGDATGRELYKSNGTAAGTMLVKDIRPGISSSGIENMTAVNSVLFFTANDGLTGHELWKTTGSASSTVLVKDMTPGPAGSHGESASAFRMANFKNIAGLLFYTAYKNNDYYIWTSNGTTSGTIARYLAAGPDHLQPRPFFTLMNNEVFFFNSQYPDGEYDFYEYSLFKTDLTASAAQPSLIQELYNVAPTPHYPELVVVNDVATGNHLYFFGTDGWGGITLFKSDGGICCPEKLYTDPYVATQSSSPHDFTPFKGKIAFLAQSQFYGSHDIYITDGTASGTRSLVGLQGESSGIEVTNNFIYSSGVYQLEIYKTSEDYPGWYGYSEWIDYDAPAAHQLTAVNEDIYFTNSRGELWMIDDVTEELSLIKTIGIMNELKPLGANLIFRVRTAANGEELWRSNGTVAGTYRYKTVRAGAGVPPLERPSATIKNTHYFIANDGIHGNEIWKTQGSGASTYMLTDLNTTDPTFTDGREYDISTFAAFRDSLYISAVGNDGAWSLFKYKSNATSLTKVINMNAVKLMVPAGNILYLFVYGQDQRTGLTLWRTNGTAQGTFQIKELPASANVSHYIQNNILYFNLNNGSDLRRSDGTECGTYAFDTGVPSSDLTGVGGTLIFNGYVFKTGLEPYIYITALIPPAPCNSDIAMVSEVERNTNGYPNPFTNEFILNVPGDDYEVVDVIITTISGFPVEKFQNLPVGTDKQIGQAWAPGLYIMKVVKGESVSSTIVVKE